MKKTMNTAAIMAAAHNMTRAAIQAAQDLIIDYRATFSAALAIAWADAKKPTAAEEWAGMDGNEQYKALIAMTWRAKKRDEASKEPPKMEWIRTPDDAQTNAAEAWPLMQSAAATAAEQGQPLSIALYRAVMTAAQRIDLQERRNARALKFEDLTDGDGATITRDYIELNAAPLAENSWNDPESATLTRDELDRAAADELDRFIIRSLAAGYNQTETARAAGISQQAVSKRINNIRARRTA